MLNRWQKIIGLLLCVFLTGPAVTWAAVSEMDVLLKVLERKGILSSQEIVEIRAETKTLMHSKKEIPVSRVHAVTLSDKVKLSGDVRLRYQAEDRGTSDQTRMRARVRLKAKSQLNEKTEVGLRLASGSSDPRSTNQTFQDNFSSKGINLDQAYVRYQATDDLILYGGKFGKTFYAPSDLLWDGDLSFEGASVNYSKKLDSGIQVGLNTGLYFLDETNTSHPMMYMVQPTAKGMLSETLSFKAGAAYLGFENLKGATFSGFTGLSDNGTNTLQGGNLLYDYDAFIFNGELAVKAEGMPRMAILGEYIINPDPDDQNEGYIVGVKIGDKKVKKQRQWQVYANYRELQKDAIFEGFPDSDFYAGETAVEGYELVFQYGLMDNVILGLDYYKTNNLDGIEIDEDLFQADVVFKF